MSGQNEHFGNLDMGRGIGSKDGNIGNVITCQRLDAFIDIGSTVVVTMEADIAEVGLDKAGLQVCDADSRIGHIDA